MLHGFPGSRSVAGDQRGEDVAVMVATPIPRRLPVHLRAAAELAAPSRDELLQGAAALRARLQRASERALIHKVGLKNVLRETNFNLKEYLQSHTVEMSKLKKSILFIADTRCGC